MSLAILKKKHSLLHSFAPCFLVPPPNLPLPPFHLLHLAPAIPLFLLSSPVKNVPSLPLSLSLGCEICLTKRASAQGQIRNRGARSHSRCSFHSSSPLRFSELSQLHIIIITEDGREEITERQYERASERERERGGENKGMRGSVKI